MKHIIQLLNFLFRPRGQIIIALMLFSTIATAQQQPEPPLSFPVGAYFNKQTRTEQAYYDTFALTGMDWIVQYAGDNTQGFVAPYNLMADNADEATDYIMHYSTAWYSKWEAEEDQNIYDKVGVKHRDSQGNLIGKSATYLGKQCWSTEGLSAPACSLVYGPHYHQEKLYKRWYYSYEDRYDKLKYIPRFNMALKVNGSVNPDEEVCRLYVTVRHCWVENGNWDPPVDDTLKGPITLRVSDFQANGPFDDFYLVDSTNYYRYPEEFRDNPSDNKLTLPENLGGRWVDIYGDQGVQFCIDWLRSDTKCTLYVDYVEVYDLEGWAVYLAEPEYVDSIIKDYALDYLGQEWSNLKYWMGHSEPFSLDAYTPIKTVDAIVKSAFTGAPSIMTTVYPYWETLINNDVQLERYYNTVQPEKLMIDFYPFLAGYTTARFDDWYWFQKQLQISSQLQPGFYYWAQAFGYHQGYNWLIWRQPNADELKAQTMMALAHGVKGIVYMAFDAYEVWEPNFGTYIHEGIIDTELNPTDLFYVLKNNIVPRLKGKLGKTLLDLDYIGDYLELRRYMGPNTAESVRKNYLTLSTTNQNPTPFTYYFHAGFFESFNQVDNNHFLVTNLITNDDRWVNVSVTDSGYSFTNTRFRNVEPEYGFDTTFTDEFSIDMQFPPGEGYLFQVAPVVLYGGRLIYDESVGGGIELNDDMIIEDGAILTIYDTYTANANIIVKNGGIVNGENGTIFFNNGSKLIIEGVANINGTPGDKLSLSFNGEDTQNGIIVDSDGSLIMSDCIVEGAETGLKALVDAGNINIQYVDFNDCISSSINILGQTVGSEAVRQIKYCTITNSPVGISASNLPELLIQENDITNTDLGITLSNISRAVVFGNYIISNTESLQGIFAGSVGGEIRTNFIRGHTYGIHLGNSSPDVGGNNITECKFHGIYVGSGSEPNMVARLIHNPNNHLWYPVSGYNVVYNNGGYEGGGNDNDGSEIYISDNANVIMSEGCNEIVDDREPSGNLVNTLLLMNGDNVYPPIQVEAQYNYWGETEVTEERFGDLEVNFDDWLSESCPLPDQGGEDMLITRTSTGEFIDTLYPSGEVTNPLSEIETLYSSAEGSFITGDYTTAENYYDQIILIDTSLSVKKEAYSRKYEIGKLLGRGTEYFNDIRNTYLGLAQTTSNILLEKVFTQLSSLSLIGEEEYVPAIGEFDEIIQQNPNTEEAVYAEIDAITTAILIQESDSTLQKGTLGKYLIKPGEEYLSKIDGILRKHFGSGKKETEEVALPTEYTLYQNYPNPFNPVTTIKYDLPNASDISLIIYDILGRKVKELVNTKQQAGRYEIQFNASSIASGVYIYQLVTDNPSTSSGQGYINAKKMILLK